MDVMEKLQVEAAGRPDAEGGAKRLTRLHIELALELGLTAKRPLQETLREAVNAAGCDVALELPASGNTGTITVVRLRDDAGDGFLQVRTEPSGFDISDEGEIDSGIVSLARASIDVLERLKAGSRLSEPTASATH